MSDSSNDNARSLRQASRTAMWAALRRLLRTRIMAGVLTVLPIWITWTIVKFVFDTARGATEPLARWVTVEYAKDPKSPIPAFIKPHLDWFVPFIAVLLTLFLLYLLGFFTSHLFGRRVLAGMERLVDRVPIAKTVYRLTKQVVTTMAGETDMARSRVVLVELYRPGIKCIGFLTSVMKDKDTGRDLCTVFIAATPNPAVGYMHIVPLDRVSETGWTMEEAIKIIVSGGASAPPDVSFERMQVPQVPPPGAADPGFATPDAALPREA